MRRLLLSTAVGAVVLAPFVWPYWQVQQREGFARNLYEASQHEAVAASYLRVPPGNAIYGRTGLLRPGPRGGNRGVAARRPGAGAVPWLRRRRPGARGCVGRLASGWTGARAGPWSPRSCSAVCCRSGRTASGGLYSLLHRFVFGFQAVRAPARFGVLVTFGLCGLAAIGVRELCRRRAGADTAPSTCTFLAAAVVVIVGLEYVNVPLPMVAAPVTATPVGHFLAHTNPDRGPCSTSRSTTTSGTRRSWCSRSSIVGRSSTATAGSDRPSTWPSWIRSTESPRATRCGPCGT